MYLSEGLSVCSQKVSIISQIARQYIAFRKRCCTFALETVITAKKERSERQTATD